MSSGIRCEIRKVLLEHTYARITHPLNSVDSVIEFNREKLKIQMLHNLQLRIPTVETRRVNARISPLLEILGVERFLLVLSSVLCEKRIIFVSNDINVISSNILAIVAMIYPFEWQVVHDSVNLKFEAHYI